MKIRCFLSLVVELDCPYKSRFRFKNNKKKQTNEISQKLLDIAITLARVSYLNLNRWLCIPQGISKYYYYIISHKPMILRRKLHSDGTVQG